MAYGIPTAPFSELVFGFVYPIGTKTEPLMTTFNNYLVQYGYQGHQSRMSEQLRSMDLGISVKGGIKGNHWGGLKGSQ